MRAVVAVPLSGKPRKGVPKQAVSFYMTNVLFSSSRRINISTAHLAEVCLRSRYQNMLPLLVAALELVTEDPHILPAGGDERELLGEHGEGGETSSEVASSR